MRGQPLTGEDGETWLKSCATDSNVLKSKAEEKQSYSCSHEDYLPVFDDDANAC